MQVRKDGAVFCGDLFSTRMDCFGRKRDVLLCTGAIWSRGFPASCWLELRRWEKNEMDPRPSFLSHGGITLLFSCYWKGNFVAPQTSHGHSCNPNPPPFSRRQCSSSGKSTGLEVQRPDSRLSQVVMRLGKLFPSSGTQFPDM